MAILINNTDIATYGAKVIDFSVGGIPYTDHYTKAPKMAFPIGYLGSFGMREINLQIDFIASDMATAEANISNMIAQTLQGCELLLPDGFYYSCVFGAVDRSAHKSAWITQINLKLFGVRHGAKITTSAITSGTVSVSGNRATPAKITVGNITDDCSITINGEEITIEGLTGTVVIDGIEGKVTSNDTNVFAATNLSKFPELRAGNNTISTTGGVNVVIEYYPLYV